MGCLLLEFNQWTLFLSSVLFERKMANNWDCEADDLRSTSGAACEAEVALAVAAIKWPLFFLLLLGSCCSVLGMLQNKQLMKTLMLVISFRLLPNRPQIGQRNKRWRMSPLPVSRSCLVLQIKGGLRWYNTHSKEQQRLLCIWLDGITFMWCYLSVLVLEMQSYSFSGGHFWLEWEINGSMWRRVEREENCKGHLFNCGVLFSYVLFGVCVCASVCVVWMLDGSEQHWYCGTVCLFEQWQVKMFFILFNVLKGIGITWPFSHTSLECSNWFFEHQHF